MSTRRGMGDEGAATPWNHSGPGMAAGMVVCPMFMANGGSGAVAVEEIYRLAYEWARATSRPSLYEIALRASCN